MIYLALSILFSSAIFLIFRWVGELRANTFHTIIVNYLVAFLFGLLVAGTIEWKTITNASWFWGAVALGAFFPLVFYIIAITAQKLGAGVAAIANKMALIIPVVFAFYYYGDEINAMKVIGMVAALPAIVLATQKKGQQHINWSLLILPIVVFVCSGIIDTALKYLQEVKMQDGEEKWFTPVLFLSAAVAGNLFMGGKAIVKKVPFEMKSLWLGLLLGMVNYGSILFLVKALQVDGMESSVLFPINNMGIILGSTLGALLLFREKLHGRNWLGLALALLAMLCMFNA